MPGHRRPNVRARRHASAALFCRSPPTATYFWGIFVRRSACTGHVDEYVRRMQQRNVVEKCAHRHREGCNVRSVRIYPVVCFRSGLLDWTSDDEQQILVQLGHRNARLECQAKLGTQHSISTVTESSRSWVCRTPQF